MGAELLLCSCFHKRALDFPEKGLIDPIMPLNDDVKSVRRQLPRLRTSFPLKEENVLKTPNQMHSMAARRTT